MQCHSCRAVYSNGLELCPRCKTPASKLSPDTETKTVVSTGESAPAAQSVTSNVTTNDNSSPAVTAPKSSSLIEFPGAGRAPRPQWRKDLSARVREIQERRARESEEVPHRRVEQAAVQAEMAAPQLGLVPTPDVPEVNPIVVAALKRLERARQSPPRSRQRASMGGAAATATARVAEEQYETETRPALAQASMPAPVALPSQPPQAEVSQQPKLSEPVREHQLAVVPALPAPKVAAPASRPQPKRAAVEVAAEAPPLVSEPETSEAIPVEEFYDDRAPFMKRIAGGLIDLVVVAFASSPFAAIIELTNGNWADWRVIASMSGIVLAVMFLYLTASTALAGRTWGMSLVSLRAVDAETGLPPTTKQSVGRALLYVVSLITLGLGLLYALFDAEGRAVHDHLSGTAVVLE
ncbi:MAG: hypothetical protein QOH63_3710 [Acidobacteriota bacterium]|nr:hypothetical protein [Acidobacteriota bacterium]